MDKFQDRYRISSHRLHRWDYSSEGYYFITLVIQNREPILGEIENSKMKLSDFGKIIFDEWYKSFEIRNELFLDEFIIMPNHLHALVVLKKTNDLGNPDNIVETHCPDSNVETYDQDSYAETHGADLEVETHGRASLQFPDKIPTSFHRKPKSISSFVTGLKSATTIQIDVKIANKEFTVVK